jgi:outer membrane immunogenic protein
MKNSISGLAVIVALGAGTALAADLPNRKAPPIAPPAPAFIWTGLYGGLNIGGGWSDHTNGAFLPIFANEGRLSGVIGGGQVGFNYQLAPMFVVGVETDFQGTSLSNQDAGLFTLRRRLDWVGTVRGRAGVALLDQRLFVYGTGGFAYGEVRQEFLGEFKETKTGWTAGGGAEYALAFLPNVSAKVEYLYTDLRTNNGGFVFGNSGRLKFHTVRAGLNYHLNLFAPPPVLARY